MNIAFTALTSVSVAKRVQIYNLFSPTQHLFNIYLNFILSLHLITLFLSYYHVSFFVFFNGLLYAACPYYIYAFWGAFLLL